MRASGFTTRPVDGGVELTRRKEVIRATALRNDVLRVRIGRDGALPKDESWAALEGPRGSYVEVDRVGASAFRTAGFQVAIDEETGAIRVADREGRTIVDDVGGGAYRPHSKGFRLDKQAPADAHYFGLGDKFGPLDRRGRAFTLWNTDAYQFQEGTDPLYKAIPFFMGVEQGRAFGLFLDNTWRSHFDFGAARPDVLSFGADGGEIDYYVFTGPDPKAVVAAYAWLTGPPPLPPLWAFGFQQSRFSYESEAEVRALADRFREGRIPADVIWFDIDVLDCKRAFTVDRGQFPDFPRLVRDLDRQGFKSVVIADLHLAAEEGYPPFDGGLEGDHFVKRPDGSTYVGEVWPGPCAFPDFSREATRAWWGELIGDLRQRDKVAGIWNDMNEPSVFKTDGKTMPEDIRHRIETPGFEPRVASHAEMHNVYGSLNVQATYDGLVAREPDRRPFVMTRAAYAGGHRHAVTWTGDNSSAADHLRLSTPQLLSLGLSGFAFAGEDLGGFTGAPSAELLTEWIKVGAFRPIARNHSDKGSPPQEVWVHGPEHEAIRRRFIEARYRLLPYLYTTAEEASRTGVPMMRPMFLEFPAARDGRPLDLDAPTQFMLGPALLIAPQPEPLSTEAYDVILPPGGWFDFWSGRKVEAQNGAADPGGEEFVRTARATPAVGGLAVFVRAGSIIPSQPLVQTTAEIPRGALRLDIYPGAECRGEVYADDGLSFGYRRDGFFRQAFACRTVAGESIEVDVGAPEGSFRPWWSGLEFAVHDAPYDLMPEPGSGLRALSYDAGRRMIRAETAAPFEAARYRFSAR